MPKRTIFELLQSLKSKSNADPLQLVNKAYKYYIFCFDFFSELFFLTKTIDSSPLIACFCSPLRLHKSVASILWCRDNINLQVRSTSLSAFWLTQVGHVYPKVLIIIVPVSSGRMECVSDEYNWPSSIWTIQGKSYTRQNSKHRRKWLTLIHTH